MDTLKGEGTLYNIQGGPDTNKGEGDKHYKKGGDGQYTGRKHMKNVSIPQFIYLISQEKGVNASICLYSPDLLPVNALFVSLRSADRIFISTTC